MRGGGVRPAASVDPSSKGRKTQDWLEAGCRMVIVIDPKKKAAVICRPGGVRTIIPAEGEIEGGDVVPGWRMGLLTGIPALRDLAVEIGRKPV